MLFAFFDFALFCVVYINPASEREWETAEKIDESKFGQNPQTKKGNEHTKQKSDRICLDQHNEENKN